MKTIYVAYLETLGLHLNAFPLFYFKKDLRYEIINARADADNDATVIMLYAWSKDLDTVKAFVNSRNSDLFTIKKHVMTKDEYKEFRSLYSLCKLRFENVPKRYSLVSNEPWPDKDGNPPDKELVLATDMELKTCIEMQETCDEYTMMLANIAFVDHSIFEGQVLLDLATLGYFTHTALNPYSTYYTQINDAGERDAAMDMAADVANNMMSFNMDYTGEPLSISLDHMIVNPVTLLYYLFGFIEETGV